MQTKRQPFIALIVALLTLSCSACFSKGNNDLLNISSEQLQKGRIKLDGEWAFYGQQFSESPGLIQKQFAHTPANIQVPSYWNAYLNYQQPGTGFGFGCYVRQISFEPSLVGKQLTVYIPSLLVPYRVYINGELKAQAGQPSPEPRKNVLSNSSSSINFVVRDTTTIVIQISNFRFLRSGLWRNIYLGETPRIELHQKLITLFGFTTSFVLFAFILILLNYYFRFPKRHGAMWLSLMILGILIEDSGLPDSVLPQLLQIPVQFMVPIKLCGLSILLISSGFCFNFYFPNRILQKTNKWLTLTAIIYLSVVCLLQTKYAELSIYWIYAHAGFIFILIFRSLIQRKSNSYINNFLFTIAALTVLFGALNDILVYEAVPLFFPNYILKYCFLAFVINTYLMIMNVAASNYQAMTRLQQEQIQLNESLEKQVQERTRELELEKQKAIEQSSIIAHNNELLQKDIALKHRIFSIIGHDLRGHTGLMVETAELLKDPDLEEEPKRRLQESMAELPHTVFAIVENLLFWGRSQNKELQASPSAVNLGTRLDEILAQFQFLASRKDIQLLSNCDQNLQVWADDYHLSILLRNLIGNAIKFTKPGGKVEVSAVLQPGNTVLCSVCDTGVGMSSGKADCLQNDHNRPESQCGTNHENGTGIGIQLCRQLLALNHGTFGIKSVLGQGSEFWFTLPASTQIPEN